MILLELLLHLVFNTSYMAELVKSQEIAYLCFICKTFYYYILIKVCFYISKSSGAV